MGIPQLTKKLKDAGWLVRKELGQFGDIPLKKAIIDGPSFAYHVVCIIHGNGGSSDLFNISSPPYNKYCEAAVKCNAIYFDAVLPASKRSTRIERLNSHAANLAALKAIMERSNGHNDQEVERACQRLAPPFVVAAVHEALLQSRFADVTFAVPDEADRFCVAAARKAWRDGPKEPTIFANDSDLLVFDSGRLTRIVPFDGFEIPEKQTLETGEEAGLHPAKLYRSVLRGWECQPGLQAETHGISDMVELAWRLMKNPKLSIGAARHEMRVRAIPQGEQYHQFCNSFKVDWQEDTLEQIAQSDVGQHCHLDARVSELTYQAEEQAGELEPSNLHMYLPFLFEDPSRKCAWEVGARLRHTAYAVLKMATHSEDAEVWEYSRSSKVVRGKLVTELDFKTIERRMLRWREQINRELQRYPQLTVTERWKYLAMQLMFTDLTPAGSPPSQQMARILANEASTDWDDIRVAAQYTAAFYSLRLFHQLLLYVNGTEEGGRLQKRRDPGKVCHRLLVMLEGMPTIGEFFSKTEDSENEWEAKWVPLVDDYQQE